MFQSKSAPPESISYALSNDKELSYSYPRPGIVITNRSLQRKVTLSSGTTHQSTYYTCEEALLVFNGERQDIYTWNPEFSTEVAPLADGIDFVIDGRSYSLYGDRAEALAKELIAPVAMLKEATEMNCHSFSIRVFLAAASEEEKRDLIEGRHSLAMNPIIPESDFPDFSKIPYLSHVCIGMPHTEKSHSFLTLPDGYTISQSGHKDRAQYLVVKARLLWSMFERQKMYLVSGMNEAAGTPS